MARLVFNAGDVFTIGGSNTVTEVFGTSGKDTITISAGAKATLFGFDSADAVSLGGNAGSYTAVRSGSSIVLTDAAGSSVTIPVSTTSQTITFADGARALVYNTASGNVELGSQAVTTTATTVTAGSGGGSSTAGQTFTLTTGLDTGTTYTGTANNDTFSSVETGNAETDTLTTGDSLDGGAGTDTLTIAVSGTPAGATTAGVSTTSIEAVRIFNNSTAAYTLDATLMEGLKDVYVNGGTNATTVDVVSGLVNLHVLNSNVNASVNATAATVVGTADSATVAVSGSALTAGITVTYNGVETINLDVAKSSGVKSATVDRAVTVVSDELETLNVTGAGNINVAATFSGAVAQAQTSTFNASSAGGAVTASITKGASAKVSVTMSGQDDYLAYNNALTKDATLVGGAGNDTLRLSNSVTYGETAATQDSATGVSGFETLRLASGVAVDARAFVNNSGLTSVIAEAGGSFTKSSISTLTQLSTGTFTAGKSTDGAADALTLNLAGAGVASTLVAADMETVTVSSGGTAANSLTMSAAGSADLTKLTVTGTKSFTATISGTALATVDASGLSGIGQAFTLDASASTAAMTVTGAAVTPTTPTTDTANTITTGEGADTITTGEYNDTITAGDGKNVVNAGDGRNTVTSGRDADSITSGSGNDTITSGLGNDTVSAGGGNDTIDVGNGNDSVTAGDGNDTVTAGTGDDVIDGGAGNDFIYNADYDDDDVITGGTGTDTLSAQALATLTTTVVQASSRFVDVTPGTSKVVTPQISGVENVYLQANLAAANDEATATTNESIDFSSSSGITNLYLEVAHNNGAGANQAKLTLSEVGASTIHLLDRDTTDDLGELVVVGAGQASLTLKGHDFDGGTDITVSDADSVTLTAYNSTSAAAVGDTTYGDVEVDADTIRVVVDGVASTVTNPVLTLNSLTTDSAAAITLSAGSNSDLEIGTDVTSTSEALDTLTITVSDDGEVDIADDINISNADMSLVTITVGVGGIFEADDINIDAVEAVTITVGAAGDFTVDEFGANGAAVTLSSSAGADISIGHFGQAGEEASFTLTGRGDLVSSFEINGDTSVNLSGWTDEDAVTWTVTTTGNDDLSFTSNNTKASVTAGNGDNTITTANGADTIVSGTGDDTISTGAGDDTITAGDGDDVINAGTGADTVDAGEGADTITITEASTARSADVIEFAQGDSSADAIDEVIGFNAIAGATADALAFATAGTDVVADEAATDVSVASVVAASDATTTIALADVINGVLEDGILTVTGANAAKVDTLDEWLAVAAVMVGAAENGADNDVVLAFEFDGSTYVAEYDFDDDAGGDVVTLQNLVKLTGVVDVVAVAAAAAANTILIA